MEFLITLRTSSDFDRKRRVWRVPILREVDVKLIGLYIGHEIVNVNKYNIDCKLGEISWPPADAVPKEIIIRLERVSSMPNKAAWIAFWAAILAALISALARSF